MKRECVQCGFKADDNDYEFRKMDNNWYCYNCYMTLI